MKLVKLSILLLYATSSVAGVGIQNPPPNAGQVPDYFGVVPNYANSPQPVLAVVTITDSSGKGAKAGATTYDYTSPEPGAYTGGVTDVKIINGGSGYSKDTKVQVVGGVGSVPISVTPIIDNGVIVGIAEFDPTNSLYIGDGKSLGKGFTVPIAGTGLLKFVDSLPGIPGVSSYTKNYPNGETNLGQSLPIAVPDTKTFPGVDYYEIAETAYSKQLHSDLPPTHLRGYKQLNVDASNPASNNQFLGPIIVAQKDRAVFIKLVNQLPIGVDGKLQVPVDHTFTGADTPDATDNRTSLHLHGGNTPWISDGTPSQWIKPVGEVGKNKGASVAYNPVMWFDGNGNLLPNSDTCTQGTVNCTTTGATNNPGDGATTFYYTNQQSARLMFYHDHAEGVTRLNVYTGLAAGYVIQDDTEQDLVNGTNKSGSNPTLSAVIPSLADTIPLVIQEKTFIPDNTIPVLNFYGPFASQLNSQDPTWRWGSGVVATGTNGNGDLWVPHVFMPNQNPGDVSGANSMGRWDYGPWFWPPFAGIKNGPITNPYFDATCVSSVTNYCEGEFIPGTPNGNTVTGGELSEPSSTPEAFNDTPLINGTAYPTLTVDPKQYRLRILSVGNDRMLNLSLIVAASNRTPVTAQDAHLREHVKTLCDGSDGAPTGSECTEAQMVPFTSAQNKITKFPEWWYSPLKGGVTFDGRPSGVFDPNSRGPAMVQIGTEGGFLSNPVVIANQPVNFEYNGKNIVVTNVKEHALLLGPAERADVLVDFTNFAGSTLLLYNDSPAPVPAFDLRVDYFTGDYDNTDTGGAFSTIPGYGPNSRTLMQIHVNGSNGSHPVDDTGTIDIPKLTSAIRSAFKNGQQPIIVPQSAYNDTYGIKVADSTATANNNHNIALIQDYTLNFTPLDANSPTGVSNTTVFMDMQPKSIIEDWTMDYGRMNALLGVEVPRTTATTQTSVPLGYYDAPTELVNMSENSTPIGTLSDGTQLWRITHNGVDSHAIHFHLFDVQIINRVGWDGAIRQTEDNELGWKDTVRMNPLEDVVLALRPKEMKDLPFKIPNHHRLMDPEHDTNSMAFNLDPTTGGKSTLSNVSMNYGWEYVWHCHILGHEENDMMRSIVVAHQPETPVVSSASGASPVVTWKDNSVTSNWVTIQQSPDINFTNNVVTFNVIQPECDVQAGCTRTYTDNSAEAKVSTVFYRVKSNNTVGSGDVNKKLPASVATLVPGFLGYDNTTAESSWSNILSRILPISPTSVSFGNVQTASSVNKVITLTNMTNVVKAFTIGTITGNASKDYVQVTNCPTSVAPNASCTITVTLTPSAVGTRSATIGFTFGSSATVALTGNGVAPASTLSGIGAFGSQAVGGTTKASVFVYKNTGVGPITVNGVSVNGNFSIVGNTCANVTLQSNGTCTISVTFAPTSAGAKTGTLSVSNAVGGSTTKTMSLSGTGTTPVISIGNGTINFGNVNGTMSNVITLSNSSINSAPFVLSSITVSKLNGGNGNYARNGGTCVIGNTLNPGTTCTIIVKFTSPPGNNTTTGSLTIVGTGVGGLGTYSVNRMMTGS